jgi:hypothetical protein
MLYATCDECGRKAKLGGEIATYSFPGVVRNLCQPHTGRDCVERRYAKFRKWLEQQESEHGRAAREQRRSI